MATIPSWVEHRDLLGVVWRRGGRTIVDGLDCWGVVVEIRRRLGWMTPDPFRDWDAEDDRPGFATDVLAEFAAAWQALDLHGAIPEAGDVAVLPSYRGHATHAAVCVGRDRDGRPWMAQGTRVAGVSAILWTRILSHASGLYRNRRAVDAA